MNKKFLVGAAILGLVATGSVNAKDAKAGDKKAAMGECSGINTCKGTGDCGGDGHECKGKNSCKGKGWVKKDKKACESKKGTWKAIES